MLNPTDAEAAEIGDQIATKTTTRKSRTFAKRKIIVSRIYLYLTYLILVHVLVFQYSFITYLLKSYC